MIIRALRRPAAVVASLLTAAACTSTRSPSASPTTGPTSAPATTATPYITPAPMTTSLPAAHPVSWKACTGLDGPQGYDCATLEVPLDYANPGGRKIGIALDRKPAMGTKIGSLLTNPGGPGASGVDYLETMVSLLSSAVLSHFDVVGFDPRGVGRSDPVRCQTGPELDRRFHLNPAPSTDAGFQQLVAADRAFVEGCQARSGPLLPFVGTVNAVRDMDEIRATVGDAKLTYLGFSYGTLLGATYAEMFPDHVRAMVLDGAGNPALDPVSSSIEQAAAFEKELNAFFGYCSQNATCPWKAGGDLRTRYDALMERILDHPLPGDGGRTLGPGEAYYAMLLGLYDSQSWPALATGLALADGGDGSVMLQYSDQYTERSPSGAYKNLLEANAAISCIDSPSPRDAAVLRRAGMTAKERAPHFGVANVYETLRCATWPDPSTSKPHPVIAVGSPPIVVVGSTGDPATPYSGAQALASQLQHGVLVTRVGDGHTGYRFSACIRSHVDSYLVSLTVPAAGILCPTH